MTVKELQVANIKLKNNVFLAPLAGYSDGAMRLICKKLGAGLCFTEMVSAKGLKYSPDASSELLYYYQEEGQKAVQIFGSDPEIMQEIACSEHLKDFDIIDINMGCPVKKVYSNGEGSALLNNLKLASQIISGVKKSNKPVSVKFRIGIDDEHIITKDFAKMCEDSGADMITIHGRTRKAMYAGECNVKEIYKAKYAVKIPVIANGGIFTKQDADYIVSETGADGVMIARGAMQNPFIFSEILGLKPEMSLKEAVTLHLNLLTERYGERAVVIFRKQMAFYLKGVRDAKKLKETIFNAKNAQEIKNVINSTFY